MSKHFVRCLGYPPGSHLYAAHFDFSDVPNDWYTFFPKQSMLLCLDPHGSIISPIEHKISREVMRPGYKTGMFNEHEVQHYYLEGTIIIAPKVVSAATPLEYSDKRDHQSLKWWSSDYYNTEEYSHGYSTPSSGTTTYAYTKKYGVYKGDGECISLDTESLSLNSWHCTYWYNPKYRTDENSTVIGSGEVYTSNGTLRYKATTTVTGHRGNNISGSFSINVPAFRVIDLGIVGESNSPDIPSAPAYFEDMYDVPETLGTDLVDRIALPQVNNIENLMGFKPKEVLPPIRDLIRKHNIKSVADFYLWYHYGASPTIGDIKTYVDYFKQLAQGMSDARNRQTINLAYDHTRYKIVMASYDAGVLEALGLSPNLGNTWDCLPFSFILDWFVKVGDVLASIDSNELISQLRVYQVTSSYKRRGQLVLPHIAGTLSYSYYERRLSSSIPQSVVRLHAGNPSKHLLDAGSLYFSAKKK